MSKGKLTRKEIKAPDEFQSKVTKALETLNLYRGWIAAGIVVVLAAIIGGMLLSRFWQRSRVETAVAFDRAFAPVIAAVLDTRAPEPGEDEATRKAREEQRTKVKSAVGDLDRFASSHADSPIGKAGVLGKAAAAFNAGDAEVAMQAWRSFLAGEGAGSMDFVLWESLGNAADAAGKTDEAERAYTEMAKAPSSLVRAYAYLHLGDLANPATALKAGERGDAARAREYYDKGLKEVGGEEALLGAAETLAKKTLQHRLLSLR